MSKKSLLLILPLILLFWFWALGRPAQGQAPCAARDGGDGDINWYCADPHVLPGPLDGIANHHNVLPAAGGCGGILTTPQAITYARTFYNPDSELLSTSDSVAVPAEFQEDGSPLSGSCFGDYYAFWVNFAKDIADGAPWPAGFNFVDANANGDADPGEITFDIAVFKPSLPASCRRNPVSTPVLVSDGDQDLADVFLADNWPEMPNALIWGTTKEDGTPVGIEIPDPLDCFFADLAVPTEMMAPIDVGHADLDGDGRPEAFIVNLLPLNVNYWETYTDPAVADPVFLWGLLPLWSFPYPHFMADPNLQNSAEPGMQGPLIAVGDNFVEGGGPTFTYSRENEATTTIAPKNFLSQPFAIEAGDFFGEDPALDLAVLHQRWLNVPEPPDPEPQGHVVPPLPVVVEPIFTPCTNVDAGGEFSDPDLDVNFLALDIKGVMGETLVGFGLSTPIESRNLSYLTSHKNLGGNTFEKQPDNASPYRYCTGLGSIDFETGNLDGDATPDFVVVNFGGFSLAGPFAPGLGEPGGLVLEVAGGVNFITDYAGGNNTEGMDYEPIVPVPGQRHPVHPIDVALGDANGDGRDDAVVTYFDSMGMNLDVRRDIFFKVPDVIRSESVEDTCPPFGMSPAAPVPPGCGHADGVWFGYNTDAAASTMKPLEEWRCRALDETANPANPGENPADAGAGGDPMYDLYECEGRADSVTCPRLDRAHAWKYEYVAFYHFDLPDTDEDIEAIRTVWEAGGADCSDIQFPPAGEPFFTCNVPGFEPNSWRCESPFMDADDVPVDLSPGTLDCRGTTVDTTVTQLPPLLKEAGEGTLQPPVRRNMIFRCGYNFNLARDSEFCVYMNNGGGGFSTSYPNLHCVDMAQYPVPRIVPQFPVNLVNLSLMGMHYFGGPACGGLMAPGVGAAGAACATMSSWGELDAEGTMGLGVWPFAIDLADLCDATGAPRPDGKADAVIGLNNSHYVAVICSKGGLEPYKSANVLWLDASTPRYKEDLRAYLQPQLDKINANLPLNFADYLKLSTGMMSGTSRVTVPLEPINGLNEFNEPETRRSIVAIQSFPWRVMITSLNSLGGLIPEILGGIAPAMGGMGGGKPAPAKKDAAMEAAPGGGGGMQVLQPASIRGLDDLVRLIRPQLDQLKQAFPSIENNMQFLNLEDTNRESREP